MGPDKGNLAAQPKATTLSPVLAAAAGAQPLSPQLAGCSPACGDSGRSLSLSCFAKCDESRSRAWAAPRTGFGPRVSIGAVPMGLRAPDQRSVPFQGTGL